MVAGLHFIQAQFGRDAPIELLGVKGFKAIQHLHNRVLVLDEWQQSLAQAIQIPKGHLRLTGKSVAPLLIRVVTNMRGVKAIEKLKWAVIDGQAQQAHVVGVHHAVAKPHRLPL